MAAFAESSPTLLVSLCSFGLSYCIAETSTRRGRRSDLMLLLSCYNERLVSVSHGRSFFNLKSYVPLMALFLVWVSAFWIMAQANAADQDPNTWVWNNPKDLGIEGLQHQTLHSKSMNRQVGYQIYLPPQYKSEPRRSFPVVYFLHGAGGNESSDAGLAALVHTEILAERIRPTIYVFPNGGKRSGYRDSKESYVRAETLLVNELGTAIDQEFRTIDNASSRLLCGFSMGGGGAVRLALKYPDRFGAAASLAAALDTSIDSGGGDNCYVHASALSEEKRNDLRLYLVVGDEDFLYPRHDPFLKFLKTLGVAYTLVVHSEVSHNLGVLSRLSADSMIRFLDRQLQSQR